MTDEHYKWMRKAVDLAAQSTAEANREDATPAVGAVIVKDGVEIASAFRGQCAEGNHAEKCAIEYANGANLKGSVVYTTLEPCSRRNAPKIACAQRLIDQGVGAVYIGLYDPNPKIYREGWRMLRDAGIDLFDFPSDLRSELRRINADFLNQYRFKRSTAGSVTFDYVQSSSYTLGIPPELVVTKWGPAASKLIHAYSNKGHVALARYAKHLHEIDDPSAMDFQPDKHAVTANEGDVVVFAAPTGKSYGIVKVERVLYQARGDDRNEITFTFEIRSMSSEQFGDPSEQE